jgi:hypothetical protein
MKLYLAFIFLFFLLFIIPNSLAQTQITNCTVIDTPGEYVLVNDIYGTYDGVCIKIVVNDTTLDCNWHSLSYNGSAIGIYVVNGKNATVKNCIVSNYSDNIRFESMSDSRVENVITNFGSRGLFVLQSHGISVKNITAYNNSINGIEISDGANSILEDVETYYTAPGNPGIVIHSPNTTLRNIYNHDEYRSVMDGMAPNSILEYSRCSNVIYGCWHILANNTIVRHNNFPDAVGLFGTFYTEVYNNTFGRPDKVAGLEIRDWQGVAPSFNKIYNNTFNNSYIFNRWIDYQPVSTEIYNNTFVNTPFGILDQGYNTLIHDNTFEGNFFSIFFYNGATGSRAFLNNIDNGAEHNCTNVTVTNIFGNETEYLGEACSPYAFYFDGAKDITINNNTIEIDTLALFVSHPGYRYGGVVENVLACNNTIVAFNKSWVYSPLFPPILLNVMRIESSQCTPFLDVTFYPSVDFGAVNPYSVVEVFPNLTVSSNMINLTYQVRGDTDWIGETQNFSISTLMFGVDRYFPYPTTWVTLELNVFKTVFHFLVNQFNNILENVWRFEVPLVRAGNYNANVTMVVSNE